jgi:translation elongation factor P/translation initiation factor 5A
VVRKWGPALDVALAMVDGAEALVVFDRKPGRKGESTYEVSAHRLDTGKAIKKQKIVADVNGFVKKLDMQILYWMDGYTTLVGRKRGQYDKVMDQRMNDSEAVYSLLDGRFVSNQPMKDLIEWTKLVKLRTAQQNARTILHVTEDLKGLELVTAEGKRVPVEVAEKFFKYDSKSLIAEVGRDGKVYFTLTIDPVNPEALGRKVADPEIIDLYVVEATGGKAKRLARLPRNERRFAWHAARDRWAVLRKHKGIDRGGTELEIYELTAR